MKIDCACKENTDALREVQEWKEAVWDEVKDLPFEEAVRRIAQSAHSAAADLGFHAVAPLARSKCVAETGGAYHAKGE